MSTPNLNISKEFFGELLASLGQTQESQLTLEAVIATSEVEAVRDRINPEYNYILSTSYSSLPEEMRPELKREIEERKLQTKRDINPKMHPAEEYAASRYGLYLSMNNIQRSIFNFMEARTRSQGNIKFKETHNALLAIYLIDERFHPYIPLLNLK